MEYNKKIDNYSICNVQSEGTENDERLRNLSITYYSDGDPFAWSPTYKKVSEDKISKIKEKLFDYTSYNLSVDCISRAIPFITIVNEVERIIFDK